MSTAKVSLDVLIFVDDHFYNKHIENDNDL